MGKRKASCLRARIAFSGKSLRGTKQKGSPQTLEVIRGVKNFLTNSQRLMK
jgi:hypothetical protein